MPTQAFILMIEDDTWHIATRTAEDGNVVLSTIEPDAASKTSAKNGDGQENTQSDLSVLASQTLVQLEQAGYSSQGVMLAIPSAWCLSASIATEGLPRRHRHRAMLYRLEDRLPMPVEELTGDFAACNGHAMGVVVRTERLASLIDALEQTGVAITSICPTDLLAAQRIIDEDRVRLCDALLVQRDEMIDLFGLRHGEVVSWSLHDGSVQSVITSLRLLALQREDAAGNASAAPAMAKTGASDHATAAKAAAAMTEDRIAGNGDDDPIDTAARGARVSDPLRLAVCGMAVSWIHDLQRELEFELIVIDNLNPLSAAVEAAERAMRGIQSPPVELRRDGLAIRDRYRQVRTPLNLVVASALLLLAILTGVFLLRAHGYSALAADQEASQVALFRGLLPGQNPPLDIRSRLAAEQRKLQAMSDVSREAPAQTSALALLQRTLSALPRELRFLLQSVRIEPRRIRLEGLVRSHSDADAIALALRAVPDINVEAPHTQVVAPLVYPGPRGEVRYEVVSFLITVAVDPDAKALGPHKGVEP